MRLLVVEDEPALCQSIAEGLRLDGYEVDTCGDGQEALELCCVERFALILLDLSLPGLDGMELLRHLRAEDGIVLSHFLCKGYFINGSRFDSTFLSLCFLRADRCDQGTDTDSCSTKVIYLVNL